MTKHQLQKNLSEYERRRKILRIEIKVLPLSIANKKRKTLANYKWRCQKIRNKLKIIDKKEQHLTYLVKKVEEFFGVNIKTIDKRNILVRGVYYKYGAENGIACVDLAKYEGVKAIRATQLRRKFTKTLQTGENKQIWENFKKYMEERKPSHVYTKVDNNDKQAFVDMYVVGMREDKFKAKYNLDAVGYLLFKEKMEKLWEK